MQINIKRIKVFLLDQSLPKFVAENAVFSLVDSLILSADICDRGLKLPNYGRLLLPKFLF